MNSNASGLARARLFAAASTLALGLLLNAPVLAAQDETNFDIPAQPMSDAIAEFSRQSRINVLVPSTVTTGKTSNAVAGEMAADEALRLLIDGTDLNVSLQNDGAFLISAVAPEVVQPEKGRSFRVAQLVEETDRDEVTEAGDEPEARKKDEITVTGTLIKGIAPESSPLLSFDREDIIDSGASSTESFIRLLPQNFGGGSSEFAGNGLPNDSASSSNVMFGTGANLRGLGSGGTLVLLNGARMAPTSSIGDFVDLSLIPVTVLERVDVLTDGASSIYGGDAVAGVINFVLRDDFEGAETALRFGTVTSGEMKEYRASQTLGAAWDTGNILGTYEYYDRDNLVLSDRPEIASPARNDGVLIPETEFFDLLPEQKRHSAMIAANQDLTSSLRVSATGLYSNRKADRSNVYPGSAGVIDKSWTESESWFVNVGAEYEFAKDWSVSFDATYSDVGSDRTTNLSNSTVFTHSLYTSSVKSAEMLVNGDLLTLPAGDVRVALGGHLRSEDFRNFYESNDQLLSEGERDVRAIFGEVLIPLVSERNAMPGIQRLEVNVSARYDDYSDFGSSTNPKVGLLWAPVESLKLRASYSTSFAPPPIGVVGDQGRSALVFPTAYFIGFLGLGDQFPTLEDTNYVYLTGNAESLTAQSSRTYTIGADFETSVGRNTFSARSTYYDIAFDGRLGTTPIPGNQNPYMSPFIALDDPDAFPEGSVILFPTADQLDAALSSLIVPPRLLVGGMLENVGIISYVGMTRNLASVETRGIDAQLNYEREFDLANVSVGLNANYIIDYVRQASETTPAIDVLNTMYNPVDLQLRGNVSATRGAFRGSVFVNYTDGYRSDDTSEAVPISSYTTVDLNLSYALKQQSFLKGALLNLSVQNVFDEMPPSTPSLGRFRLAGYDPTNASPLGRFIALELRASF